MSNVYPFPSGIGQLAAAVAADAPVDLPADDVNDQQQDEFTDLFDGLTGLARIRARLPHPPSDDQADAHASMLALVEARKRHKCTWITLAGPAGTGKTFMLRWLLDTLDYMGVSYVACALSGRAAAQARRATGRLTKTLHGAIYGEPEEEKQVDADGNVMLDANGKAIKTGKLMFGDTRAPVAAGGVLIIDEAGMLNTQHRRDIEGVMPPGSVVICVGDREQLPPIEGVWGVDWTRTTALLNTVHRQAMENPIVALATAVRTTAPYAWPTNDERLRHCGASSGIDPARWLAAQRQLGADATLLCWTHRTRKAINAMVRNLLGYDRAQHVIADGEHIMCTANNHSLGIMNGEVVQASAVQALPYAAPLGVDAPGRWLAVELDNGRWVTVAEGLHCADASRWRDARKALVARYSDDLLLLGDHVRAWLAATGEYPADPLILRIVNVDVSGATVLKRQKALGASPQAELARWMASKLLATDHGQILTCHKAQGSQWALVGLCVERGLYSFQRKDPEFVRRWLYTAVTRAAEQLRLWDVP